MGRSWTRGTAALHARFPLVCVCVCHKKTQLKYRKQCTPANICKSIHFSYCLHLLSGFLVFDLVFLLCGDEMCVSWFVRVLD